MSFDPAAQPSLVLDVDPDTGFAAFNTADFATTTPRMQLATTNPPAGWGGSTKFSFGGYVLLTPAKTLGANLTLATLQNGTGNGFCFSLSRDGTSNKLFCRIATSLTDAGSGNSATGSQLVCGNKEQPGTQWGGQGYIHIAVVFDGTQTGNSNRLQLYVNGVLDPSVTFSGTIPAALTSPPAGTPFTLGWGPWDGGSFVGGMYNWFALPGHACTAAEVAALANLASGSGYPKPYGFSTLPAGAPTFGAGTSFWQLSESSAGSVSVNRADSAPGAVTLSDPNKVPSKGAAAIPDQSGHHNDGTAATHMGADVQATTAPQLVTADVNGHNAIHFAPNVTTNCNFRFGQLGLTNNPVAYTKMLVVNYDFADAAHEMNVCGSDVNSSTAAGQVSANAWGFTDNDDFSLHSASLQAVAGDGTNYDAWSTAAGAITPGTYQVLIERHVGGVSEWWINGVKQTTSDIGQNPFWAPGGAGGTNYVSPLNPSTTGTMAEWSLGDVGNIGQASFSGCPMVKVARHQLFTDDLGQDGVVQLATWAGKRFNVASPTPAAPTGVSATPSSGGVALGWAASPVGSGVNSYSVYRSTISGAETLLASGLTSPSYLDLSGTLGTTYFYKITASILTVAGNTESALSGEVSAQAGYHPSRWRIRLGL